MSSPRPPRIAARAILLHQGRVLLVNAFPESLGRPPLWCLPGGGVEAGDSLHETLAREVAEETGLSIRPGALAAVSEFRDPDSGFHQIDHFFRAELLSPLPPAGHADPAGVVTLRRWTARAELPSLPHAPAFLDPMAWEDAPAAYHGIRRMIRT